MTDPDRQRLIEFLEKKMCGPCRRTGADPVHDGCVEAEGLISIVEADQ